MEIDIARARGGYGILYYYNLILLNLSTRVRGEKFKEIYSLLFTYYNPAGKRHHNTAVVLHLECSSCTHLQVQLLLVHNRHSVHNTWVSEARAKRCMVA